MDVTVVDTSRHLGHSCRWPGLETTAGLLQIPVYASGVVLVTVGGNSDTIQRALQAAGLGTLVLETSNPPNVELDCPARRFGIGLISELILKAADWLQRDPATAKLPIGYLGFGARAACGLIAAAYRPDMIRAVVCLAGYPDLAGGALKHVEPPTLLVVDESDVDNIKRNCQAAHSLRNDWELKIVSGARRFFDEPLALEPALQLAADWFDRNLTEPIGSRWPQGASW